MESREYSRQREQIGQRCSTMGETGQVLWIREAKQRLVKCVSKPSFQGSAHRIYLVPLLLLGWGLGHQELNLRHVQDFFNLEKGDGGILIVGCLRSYGALFLTLGFKLLHEPGKCNQISRCSNLCSKTFYLRRGKIFCRTRKWVSPPAMDGVCVVSSTRHSAETKCQPTGGLHAESWLELKKKMWRVL